MRFTPLRLTVCVVLFAVLASSPCLADDAGEAGRRILDGHRKTVVTVKLVTKISFGGGAEEIPQEITGTVIAPTGLTVVALSEADPMSMLEGMMGGMMGQDSPPSAEVADVKLLLEDGTEVESEVVLRDKDSDLAFVRPREELQQPMACVDLAQAAAPQLLDQVIALNRLGKVAGREYSVSVERIETIIKKPRTFYVLGKAATLTGLGSPIFTLDGKFIGLLALRTIKATGGGMGSMFGGMPDNIMPVIVTAEDIAESAEQVPEFIEKEEVEPGAESEEAEEPVEVDEPAAE